MNRHSWIIICLTYIVALLSINLFYFSSTSLSWSIYLTLGLLLALMLIIAKFTVKLKVENKVWLIALIIAYVAIAYFSFRIPQPHDNDISHFVTSEEFQTVTVTGKVLTEPRLNSDYKTKFTLQAITVKENQQINEQNISGKLYVTLPLLLGNQITPQQIVTIEGVLYKPSAAKNAKQFNFQKYLSDRGIFAGLSGWNLIEKSETKWGWYILQKRILQAQVKGLGSPLGQLVSSIVLGRKAVDLPEDIRALFVKSGLAHVLAASGFHVSLLLGIILKLTKFFSAKQQLIIGTITLLLYSCLTGFSPSIIRASLMGFSVLFAIVNKAKVRPLGSLLLAAIIILLINPLWIGDLSFQLSFLATFGLITTLPVLEKKLDWLPSQIGNLITIPLAASAWTIPLVTYVFNTVTTYSILVNIITTPLITIISIGGMITSAIALLIPALGSYLSWLLKYPTLLLLSITKFFTNLPGSTFAVGQISLGLLLLIYSLIILLWLNRQLQKRWWLCLIVIIFLVIIPLRYQQANLLQVTILDSPQKPSIVIQDRGQVILIDGGDSKTIKYTILPFLAKQGINHLDYYAIAHAPASLSAPRLGSAEIAFSQTSNYQANLSTLQSQVKIGKIIVYGDRPKQNWQNSLNQTSIAFNSSITTNSITIEPVNKQNALNIKFSDQQWLLTNYSSFNQIVDTHQINTLIWWGQNLNPKVIDNFQGQTIISNSKELPPSYQNQLLTIYSTKQYATISWTPQTEFTTATEIAKRNNTLW